VKLKRDRMKKRENMNQLDLTGIWRTFYPQVRPYTFFSTRHGTFSNIDHIIGYKTSLNRYEKIEIIPCILSDHKGLRLNFNNNNKQQKVHIPMEPEQLYTQ
jgi:exonuclease III